MDINGRERGIGAIGHDSDLEPRVERPRNVDDGMRAPATVQMDVCIISQLRFWSTEPEVVQYSTLSGNSTIKRTTLATGVEDKNCRSDCAGRWHSRVEGEKRKEKQNGGDEKMGRTRDEAA